MRCASAERAVPELPEVETTRRGIEPFLRGQRIADIVVRQAQLRWPVPKRQLARVRGETIHTVARRAKYLLLHTEPGAIIVHLGMSGSLRVVPRQAPVRAHDHIDLAMHSGKTLRFHDPRRFGCWLWQVAGDTHELLAELGPEPLGDAFDVEHLWRASRGRSAPVKNFIMDQHVVVGVGSIYAAEALFRAGIHPRRAAGKVSHARYAALVDAIRYILHYAITRGGTTLRDFINPEGEPVYFEQELLVYGREGEACRVCGTRIRSIVLGQRASCYCPQCQD